MPPNPGKAPTRQPMVEHLKTKNQFLKTSFTPLAQPFSCFKVFAIDPWLSSNPTISGSANRPNPTIIKGTPSIRYKVSKVYRGSPVIGAVPMVPIIKPRKQDVSPLIKLSPVSAPTIKSAKTTNRNCSPKPNAIIIGMA